VTIQESIPLADCPPSAADSRLSDFNRSRCHDEVKVRDLMGSRSIIGKFDVSMLLETQR